MIDSVLSKLMLVIVLYSLAYLFYFLVDTGFICLLPHHRSHYHICVSLDRGGIYV